MIRNKVNGYVAMFAVVIFCMLTVTTVHAKKNLDPDLRLSCPGSTLEEWDARMKWWNEARFGMFIHWGAYSYYGGYYKGQKGHRFSEWLMKSKDFKISKEEYAEMVKVFNPVEFNAEDWVLTAKGAGMKYMVITSKHHDGFCMFDSEHTDFDIVDQTQFKRDPIAELDKACQKHGIKLGLYYSQPDWHVPYEHNSEAFNEFRLNQVRELIRKYNVSILWFDDARGLGHEGLYNEIRRIAPDIIINDRVISRSVKQADYASHEVKWDTYVEGDRYWEYCTKMGKSWGYRKGNEKIQSKGPQGHILVLVRCAARGGNLLLNVGPDGRGNILSANKESLAGIGEWMKVNGKAIYGTDGAGDAWDENALFYYTVKPGYLFAILKDRSSSININKDGSATLNIFIENPGKVKAVYCLADKDKTLALGKDAEGSATIKLDADILDQIMPVIVFELK